MGRKCEFAPSYAGQSILNGDWVIGEGSGRVEIRGSTWQHSTYGSASIKKSDGAADFEVHYHDHQGVRCSYRAETVLKGNVLVLTATDKTQSSDYCPSGKFSRIDD